MSLVIYEMALLFHISILYLRLMKAIFFVSTVSHQMTREVQYGQLCLFKSVDPELMSVNMLLKKSMFCKQVYPLTHFFLVCQFFRCKKYRFAMYDFAWVQEHRPLEEKARRLKLCVLVPRPVCCQ